MGALPEDAAGKISQLLSPELPFVTVFREMELVIYPHPAQLFIKCVMAFPAGIESSARNPEKFELLVEF